MTNSNDDAVTLSINNGIAKITLNRGASGNAINPEFLDSFDEASLICSESSEVRAVLIESEGPRFCVGGDIQPMIQQNKSDSLGTYIRKCNAQIQGALARLHRMAAPSVVAVQGVAAGGGVSLLASADVVVASREARFVCAYPSIGFCCDMGGSSVLARRMGVSRAQRFYLMHEDLNVDLAKEAGLVDYVADGGDLHTTALSIAEKWATGPTLAYGEIRKLMRTAVNTSYESQMELETQSLAGLTKTLDAKEAITAFIEKRKATYRGR